MGFSFACNTSEIHQVLLGGCRSQNTAASRVQEVSDSGRVSEVCVFHVRTVRIPRSRLLFPSWLGPAPRSRVWFGPVQGAKVWFNHTWSESRLAWRPSHHPRWAGKKKEGRRVPARCHLLLCKRSGAGAPVWQLPLPFCLPPNVPQKTEERPGVVVFQLCLLCHGISFRAQPCPKTASRDKLLTWPAAEISSTKGIQTRSKGMTPSFHSHVSRTRSPFPHRASKPREMPSFIE